ncbi:MAG: uroporphyrinogen-III synthase [Gammaproteobacteria bacterium]|nr:uroporphyrinogen-III synthase [Gammaproteobacteria bacterium]
MSCDLTGIGVLITRPRGQAEALCDLISDRGGSAIRFPTIAIDGPEDPARVRALLRQVPEFDLVIFVSPNAVRYGLALLGDDGLPPGLPVAAVGKGSARVLSELGVAVDVLPQQRFDSEALLELPQLTRVVDRRILILRGNGGRSLLGDTLRERGAEVEYVEVYTRQRVAADATPLISTWREQVQIVAVTSCEILDNLFRMLGEQGRPLLCQTPLVVVSDRIQARARELGCNYTVVAPEASDQGLLRSICNWAEEIGNRSA